MKPELNICFSCVGSKNLPVKLKYDFCWPYPQNWLRAHESTTPKMKAIDLYSGPGYDQVRRIIANLEEKYTVNVYIFSAGYGIIHGDKEICGYDATFSSSAKANRVFKREQKEWLSKVSDTYLPKGTVCVLPKSYSDPYDYVFGNLDDMILVQGTSEDRKDLGCSMIRCTTSLMEGITTSHLDKDPSQWSDIRGYEV